jgi:hypothetical protein
MNCLRKIKGITKRDRIRNADIRAELKIEMDIVQKIKRRRLRYYGHVVRMSPERFPSIAMMFGRVHGARQRGRPRKRWHNNIEEDIREMGMDAVQASRLAACDREQWRTSVMRLPMRGSPSPRH